MNGQTHTGGVWSVEEALHHINFLELLAAFLAIQTFGRDWRDVTVLIRTNFTAVTYVNGRGGTCSKQLALQCGNGAWRETSHYCLNTSQDSSIRWSIQNQEQQVIDATGSAYDKGCTFVFLFIFPIDNV